MRSAGLLLAALGFLSACTATTSPDEDCITAGGLCFTTSDIARCGSVVSAACGSGYTCCTQTEINASNIVDGEVVDAGIVPVLDAGSDGGVDSSVTDSAARDGSVDR
jgi:hypothetical protein